jgi:hypothetical protein
MREHRIERLSVHRLIGAVVDAEGALLMELRNGRCEVGEQPPGVIEPKVYARKV